MYEKERRSRPVEVSLYKCWCIEYLNNVMLDSGYVAHSPTSWLASELQLHGVIM
jgi:hypothetical protein